MTKSRLINWLQRKWTETHNTARKEYDTAQRTAKEAFLQKVGFEASAAEMQEHIEAAFAIWKAFQKECKANEDISLSSSYGGPCNRLYEYVGKKGTTFRHLSQCEINVHTKAMAAAEAAYKDLANNINNNYQNVLATVHSLRTAKEGMEYLTALGFDLSELETPPEPVTALAVQVDPSYLFIRKAA